jgi:hypothetical protein
VVCAWGVDVFGVAVWCVFPAGEDEDGCAGCVRVCEVCAGDCMFHGAAHAFVVVFRVGYVCALPCVWGCPISTIVTTKATKKMLKCVVHALC